MTDKVQKILSEIATRKLCTMDEHMAFYNDKAKEDYRFLSEIEELINTLQKEPVCKDFEVALEKKIREAQDWTYIEEEGGECPLNEEFGADDLEEFARWGADWVRNNKKEPVSEVLLDTTQTITYKGEVYTRCYKDKLDAFACKYPMSVPKSSKRYAKYSDVDLTIAVKEGANWQKQQMMAEAIDVEVKVDAGGYPYIDKTIELYDYDKDVPLAKKGDKYKVVLIKED